MLIGCLFLESWLPISLASQSIIPLNVPGRYGILLPHKWTSARHNSVGRGMEVKGRVFREEKTFNARLGLLFPLAQQVSQKLSGGSDMAWRGILPSITFDIL